MSLFLALVCLRSHDDNFHSGTLCKKLCYSKISHHNNLRLSLINSYIFIKICFFPSPCNVIMHFHTSSLTQNYHLRHCTIKCLKNNKSREHVNMHLFNIFQTDLSVTMYKKIRLKFLQWELFHCKRYLNSNGKQGEWWQNHSLGACSTKQDYSVN